MMYKLLISLTMFIMFSANLCLAEPALNNVNKSGKINCGYIGYSPALVKDFKSGEWRGFDYEIISAVATRLELEVDYTVPTGWASVVADLNADKFDMLCSGFWVHPNVGKFALFSRPAFFQPVFVVARASDVRFNADTNLNNPNFKMVALEGDNPVNIAKSDFPDTKIIELSNMTDFSQVLANVATGKADFTIVDAFTFGAFNETNEGFLRIVNPDKPVRVYPVSYVFKSEDVVFRGAVNSALDELILDGSIDRIFDKYDKYENAYYRAVVPYNNPYKN